VVSAAAPFFVLNRDHMVLQSLSRSQLFWLCQCGGWAVYAVLTALMIKIPSQEPWQVALPHLLLDTSFGFLLTLLLRH